MAVKVALRRLKAVREGGLAIVAAISVAAQMPKEKVSDVK
jgi:hypothetical protein